MTKSSIVSILIKVQPEKNITAECTDISNNPITEIIEGDVFYISGSYTENSSGIPDTVLYLYQCDDLLCNNLTYISNTSTDENGMYVFELTAPDVDTDTSVYFVVSDIELIWYTMSNETIYLSVGIAFALLALKAKGKPNEILTIEAPDEAKVDESIIVYGYYKINNKPVSNAVIYTVETNVDGIIISDGQSACTTTNSDGMYYNDISFDTPGEKYLVSMTSDELMQQELMC